MISPIKYLSLLSIGSLFAFCLACGQSNSLTDSKEETKPIIIKKEENTGMKGFAVLELFTSEGCSSCPPADRLLRDLIEDSKEKNLDIYALSFHVDYWDRLGWKDPYSSSAFSDRQRDYAKTLHSTVYTPQLVVNGKEELVGSNRAKAAMAIKQALNSPQKEIEIDFDAKLLGNSLSYSFKSKGKIAPSMLNIALVESGLSQEVSRGENRGRVLKHGNVVRTFETVELDAMMGRGILSIPKDMNLEKAQIIFYVQEIGNKGIVTVKAIDLGKTAGNSQ